MISKNIIAKIYMQKLNRKLMTLTKLMSATLPIRWRDSYPWWIKWLRAERSRKYPRQVSLISKSLCRPCRFSSKWWRSWTATGRRSRSIRKPSLILKRKFSIALETSGMNPNFCIFCNQSARALVEANRKLVEIFEKKIQGKLAEIWGENVW